ncbi:MAG: pyruvate kinase [Bacteroidia bacterium]|nr:pyruvate kinase [Bacteroidia bacterium]
MLKNVYKSTFNRTKIVATIGPATSSYEMLKQIMLAGVDVCRVNMSHGTYEQHKQVIDNVRAINKEFNSNVCILLDLQGPKLRVGNMGEKGAMLEKGQSIALTTDEIEGNATTIPIRFESLSKDVKPGERILLDDGKIHIKITEIINDTQVMAVVTEGGVLKSNKGFNLPETSVSFPALTEKDIKDLAFGLENEVEWVGLSFVRHANDILDLKQRIAAAKSNAVVIAKIEKPDAVKNIDSIIDVTDGVMVARGDLGVEMPIERVPLIQKEIVEKCLAKAKPVIIATQMMESMIERSIPTRAEVTDVANAVIDGADAVMLSGETSVGENPVLVVETMDKIIRELEKDKRVYYKGVKPTNDSPTFLSDEICFTAVRMSDHINAKVIAGMTRSGYNGHKLSSYRPEADIFIFTDNLVLLNRMNLVWGVRGFYYDKFSSTDETFADVIQVLKNRGGVEAGDKVIHTASMPILKKERTNTIKITIVD